MTKRILVPHDKGAPRYYTSACKVSRAERSEILAAAQRANLAVADLTRICTLHVIREGSIGVETTVAVKTHKDEEEQVGKGLKCVNPIPVNPEHLNEDEEEQA